MIRRQNLLRLGGPIRITHGDDCPTRLQIAGQIGRTIRRDTGARKGALEFIIGEIVFILSLGIRVGVQSRIGGRLAPGFDLVVGAKGILYLFPPIFMWYVPGWAWWPSPRSM